MRTRRREEPTRRKTTQLYCHERIAVHNYWSLCPAATKRSVSKSTGDLVPPLSLSHTPEGTNMGVMKFHLETEKNFMEQTKCSDSTEREAEVLNVKCL